MAYNRERSLLWLERDWRALGALETVDALISGSLERREAGVKRLHSLYLRERRLCERGCGDQPFQFALYDMWVGERDLLMRALGQDLARRAA